MNTLFEGLINMSITGSIVIAIIILVRFLLRGAPKKYSYALWSVAFFRLCCPFSFKSIISVFNINPFQSPSELVTNSGAMNYIGTPVTVNPIVTPQIPDVAIGGADEPTMTLVSSSPFDSFADFLPLIWLVGVLALIAYGVISYIRLSKRLATATRLDGNIYQSDMISSPFILGSIKPKIYIPYGIDDGYREYVIAHEKYHLKRLDNVVKLLAFVVLCLHWFNPLCWLAFSLMSKDMEMSCDEWVLAHNENIKKEYSTALLSFATNKKLPSPSPLCFSEDSAKSRIKNVLRYKKPTIIVTVIALVLCAVVAVACISNPRSKNSGVDLSDIYSMNIGSEMPSIIYADDENVIFYGTCGIINFDYQKREITQRASWKDIEALKWSEDREYTGIQAYSDGKSVLLTEQTVYGESNYKYRYDVKKNKFRRIDNTEEPKLYESVVVDPDDANGEYYSFIEPSRYDRLIGDFMAKRDNKFFYLRANDDWSMKSLQLVVCDLEEKKITQIIDLFFENGDISSQDKVTKLNDKLKELSQLYGSISSLHYVPDMITQATDAKYLGDSGSGLYVFSFEYDGITFTINTPENYYFEPSQISYYVDGKLYAYNVTNDELVFVGKENESKIIFNGLGANASYQPFSLKGKFEAYNDTAFTGTLKNDKGLEFRIADYDAKYADTDGLDSKYTKAIVYSDDASPDEALLLTFYPDLNLLAYIDDNLFFSAGDTIYRMKLIFNEHKAEASGIYYVCYGQYNMKFEKENTLALELEREKFSLDTKTGEITEM